MIQVQNLDESSGKKKLVLASVLTASFLLDI